MATKEKGLKGIVVSTKMEKTCVIKVDFFKKDKRFKKIVRRSKKVFVSDVEGQAKEGDLILAVEGRPISKNKCHKLIKVIEKAR